MQRVIKMKKCCLAVDIGASSGRLIAGHLEDERLNLKEIHRFENKWSKKWPVLLGA